MRYTKVPLSNAALLARWQDKGLAVPCVMAAERALNFVGYFRLRGYALSLMISTPAGRMFQPGVRFEDVIARYEFDRVLRRTTLGQLERIEVAVRTVISNQMSIRYGPFWYLNHPAQVLGYASGYGSRPDPFPLGSFLGTVERETRRSRDLFAQHYFGTYTEPLLPPSWLMAECLSFGKWSQLYKHLQKADRTHPNPKKIVAKAFGLAAPLVESWLHALTLLRNICAHHGRVWNRRFAVRPAVYHLAAEHFNDPQSYYCLAVVMRLFSKAVDSQDEWPVRLMDLFRMHPAIAPADLGFPQGWDAASIWND
ncbi:Abi family protein [Achromobacter sp. SD115]|uniref:Abi family protein n=1 Tax=Achromobacter sp. SD115 TaxID=2782011 RepID=UPI001A974630|nr:Abi family protein [Achromobacter sp. SD115]